MGNQERECLLSGMWSGNQPVCSGINIIVTECHLAMIIGENRTELYMFVIISLISPNQSLISCTNTLQRFFVQCYQISLMVL